MQRSFGDNVDLSAQEVFEVLLQGHVIDKAPSFFHVHQQVEVTFRILLSAGRGAKEPNVQCPMLIGQSKDFFSMVTDRWMHVGFAQ
ncbi:hypothetical protein GGP75_002127 [Salinibacter ruber]|nr:hypothetical protein [Salinibacter ruber]